MDDTTDELRDRIHGLQEHIDWGLGHLEIMEYLDDASSNLTVSSWFFAASIIAHRTEAILNLARMSDESDNLSIEHLLNKVERMIRLKTLDLAGVEEILE